MDTLGLRCSWEIQVEILLSCWMWTPEESRARNIHLDQSVYRWASWQGYVQDNEEIVWDEKTTVGLLTASKHRKKKKRPSKL